MNFRLRVVTLRGYPHLTKREASTQCVGPWRAYETFGARNHGARSLVPGDDGGDFAHWGHRFGGGFYSGRRPQCTKSPRNGVANVQSRALRTGSPVPVGFARCYTAPRHGFARELPTVISREPIHTLCRTFKKGILPLFEIAGQPPTMGGCPATPIKGSTPFCQMYLAAYSSFWRISGCSV